MRVELVKIQRAVVIRRGQTEAIIHKALLTRAVSGVHGAHLRQRHVRFIDEQQKIIREIIEQCARLAAGLTARKHARIVFDALAHTDLAEHFNIIACTLLDALRFDEFIFGLKKLDAFFHFGLDLLERDRHFFARNDVMRRRVDGDML